MFKNISRSSNWIRRSSANSSPVAAGGSSAPMSIVQRCAVASVVDNLQLIKELNRQQLRAFVSAACTSNVNFHRNMSSTMKADQQHGPANRLALEKSPYLRQHAHNPVDWYPWCDEAIQRARDENKMIFLSIGYSSCHWCHVMEHESFANDDVAKIMNENFINIKVDREERPDIDRIYMEFVKMVNDSAGWPMSVWLTPDLSPVMAGTYFPPVDSLRRPSFTKVLLTVADKWTNEREVVMSAGSRLIDTLRRSLNEKDDQGEAMIRAVQSVEHKLETAFSIFERLFDPDSGGFGMHPKFPEVSRLNLIFHNYTVHKDADALHMALYTLQKIGHGGIRDHIGGGFARYSVDEWWHVPHFEKMLYDQGQLMAAYATAYKMTGNEWFLQVADGIFGYIMTYLRHPDGGFYCGEDADSLPDSGAERKVEGAFYAWKASEICAEIEKNAAHLPTDIDVATAKRIYMHHYDIQPEGNVDPNSDPHRVLMGQNILIVRQSEEDTGTKFGLSAKRLRQLLHAINRALCCVRDQRPRPQLDIKIITSWNGLMLSGLAHLASCQTDKRAEYLQAAKELIAFMRQHLYDGNKRILIRSVYGVDTSSATLEPPNCSDVAGFLDDYSFLIKGLLDYYTVSLERSALLWAKELQDTQDTLFWDSTEHGYFFSQANTPHVVMRFKGGHDGAEPGGNSIAARNLILLAHYFDDKAYHERAGQLFEYFANVTPFGYLLPEMLCALLLYERGLDLITVVGPDTPQTKHLLEICQHFYIPGAVISYANPQQPHDDADNGHVLDKFKMINEKATVYICHNSVCRMPITEPEELRRTLTENFVHEDNN